MTPASCSLTCAHTSQHASCKYMQQTIRDNAHKTDTQHTFVSLCVHVYRCAHVCVCARGELRYAPLLLSSLLQFSRRGSSLDVKLTIFARLAGQRVPRSTCIYTAVLRVQVYVNMPGFYVGTGGFYFYLYLCVLYIRHNMHKYLT